jgi:putative nucleotidyltransferase with HDIG domain
MINLIDKAMQDLQAAVDTRTFYPATHPRVRAAEAQAFGAWQEALRQRVQVQVMCIGERVLFETQRCPSSANLARNIFNRLKARGSDALTLRRGLNLEELQCVVDYLARPEAQAPGAAAPHFALASVAQGARKTGNAARPARKTVEPDQASAQLPGLWQGVARGQPNMAGVERLANGLGEVIQENQGLFLPLLTLKQSDEYTYVHTVNVAMLAASLAEAAGFNHQTVHGVIAAALLHDVGKMNVPNELLNKTAALTPDDLAVLRRHPVDGACILFGLPQMPDLAPVVAFEHHLGIDCEGYPHVPRGWRVTAASQVVQIVDVFDALRSDRPYRKGLEQSAAVELMRKDAGTKFDKALLDCFIESVVPRDTPQREVLSQVA